MLLLERLTSGEIRLGGGNVARMKGAVLRQYRRSVQAVFQADFTRISSAACSGSPSRSRGR
jgi:ABC-type methionine transport system ATPase subunit